VNKRIRELAEQAEKYADANFKGEPFWTEAYESKFAELIIRECAEIADMNAVEAMGIYGKVLEHFGVEL